MTVEISSSAEQVRSARGLALKMARKTAGLSAERLAQFVNERTAGSDVTRHAIYSYEQGKVLLSREVGQRIATALQLHPGQLLLGDPEYAPTPPGNTPGNVPGSNPGSTHGGTPEINPNIAHRSPGSPRGVAEGFRPLVSPDNTAADAGVAVALRVGLVVAAQQLLPVAEVLVRLLGKNKLGRVEIAGHLDVFHLLLEDTYPLTRSHAFGEIQAFGDMPGNEHPFALASAISRLHHVANDTLKRLIAPDHESPVSLHEYCEAQTRQIDHLAKTIHGEIDACNQRLPGVSLEA